MLFNFQLRSPDTITPWLADNQPYLHWFGLTDGWYWLDVGTDILFQYTEPMLRFWNTPIDPHPYRAYVDYQVARLWEDVLEQLPSILEPIPDRVLQRLQPGIAAIHWRDAVIDQLVPEHGEVTDQAIERLDRATDWLETRWLDVGYLRAGPRIWLWNDGDMISLHWDNRGCIIDDVVVWTATHGTITIPMATFIDEVRSFHARLLGAMHTRIVLAQDHWPRPNVQIDLPRLVKQQHERSGWLEQALVKATHRAPTSWDTVVTVYDAWSQGLLHP
ncbi:MAG: DUF5984 family protein [Caldilineaceae bacterium]